MRWMASFNSPVWFNVGVREPRGYGWAWDKQTEQIQQLVIARNLIREARG